MMDVEPRAQPRIPSQAASRGSRPLAILVVEDEEDTRLSWAALIHAKFPGTRVVTADDGEAAIAALDRTRFDLAIVDYQLPYADGLAVARHSKQTGNAPCILVTGYVDPMIGAAAQRDGIILGTIHKTASSAEIIRKLQAALSPAPMLQRPGSGRLPQSEAP
jgi:CheY-like chemotaxis protein